MTQEKFERIVAEVLARFKTIEFFMFEEFVVKFWVRDYSEMCIISFYDEPHGFREEYSYLCPERCSGLVREVISCILDNL